MLTVTIAFTFMTIGFVILLGSYGIITVFVAGLAYKHLADPGDEAEEQRVQEVINRPVSYPVFILFGMVIPWEAWAKLGWHGIIVVIGILLFRRLPILSVLQRVIPPTGPARSDAFRRVVRPDRNRCTILCSRVSQPYRHPNGLDRRDPCRRRINYCTRNHRYARNLRL